MPISALGRIAGWAWMLLAGGGGLLTLITRGPWPPTHGWFDLASGLAACPLIGGAMKRYVGIGVSGWIQVAVAALFLAAGRVALTIWPNA